MRLAFEAAMDQDAQDRDTVPPSSANSELEGA
jgi:hypothetical protein